MNAFTVRRILRLSLLLAACSITAGAAETPATNSAFLAAHANNAVKWLPWGDAAIQRAKSENKPIYLHIGLFTSELSHAMSRQSFTNAEAAKFLNDNFVCVLVDRDEQPELAALYRAYVHSVKQLDGWPINVWLTPDLKPFEGATYLPPSEEWGKPGLMNVAKQVAGAWQSDPAAQRQKAAEAVTALQTAEKLPAPTPVAPAALSKLVAENTDAWKAKFDATNGGFGDPPKRLEPELLRFLLRDAATRDLAFTTLRAMADGAIRDQLDGGFFRQAIDPAWRQPYFQKTLADQARIALAYLDAAKVDPDVLFTVAARGALAYTLDELGDPARGFVGAEDTTGEAISYYLWTLADFRAALGQADGDKLAAALGVMEAGNIPDDAYSGVTTAHKCILYRAKPITAAGEADEMKLRARLLDARKRRPGLRVDSLATSGAHGIVLTALARAAAELNDARFRTAAQQLVTLLKAQVAQSDGSVRRFPGRAIAGAPEDYALVIEGLKTFGAAMKDRSAEQLAAKIQAYVDQHFYDQVAGRYFASAESSSPAIWTRVHVPAPAAGELPAPETTTLLGLDDQSPRSTQMAAALAVEVRDATDAPRGDLLLALRSFAGK